MRDKRVMRAEEKANMLPTKLTLGTMMFTVPPLMIILIGPSVYGIAPDPWEGSATEPDSGVPGCCHSQALLSAGRLSIDRRPWRIAMSRRQRPYGVDARGEAVDGLLVGHRLMEAGEYELALKAYYRAAAEQGINVDVLSAIGSANLALGRLGQAETLLRRAVEAGPDLRARPEQPWRGADGTGQTRRGAGDVSAGLCAGQWPIGLDPRKSALRYRAKRRRGV